MHFLKQSEPRSKHWQNIGFHCPSLGNNDTCFGHLNMIWSANLHMSRESQSQPKVVGHGEGTTRHQRARIDHYVATFIRMPAARVFPNAWNFDRQREQHIAQYLDRKLHLERARIVDCRLAVKMTKYFPMLSMPIPGFPIQNTRADHK